MPRKETYSYSVHCKLIHRAAQLNAVPKQVFPEVLVPYMS